MSRKTLHCRSGAYIAYMRVKSLNYGIFALKKRPNAVFLILIFNLVMLLRLLGFHFQIELS